MDRLQQLYREVILEHSRRPRNFRRLHAPARCADGINQLCGDRLRLCVNGDGARIDEAAFEGAGCAISIASASLLTEAVAGRTCDDALALADRLEQALSGTAPEDLGALEALCGVRAFPTRIRCATLAWRALRAALHGETRPVSTERAPNTPDTRTWTKTSHDVRPDQ